MLRDRRTAKGTHRAPALVSDYGTAIGAEIGRALRGDRQYGADVMRACMSQPLDYRQSIRRRPLTPAPFCVDAISRRASPTAQAQGLRSRVAHRDQKFLPPAGVPILLDIPPDASTRREEKGRTSSSRTWPCGAGCPRQLSAAGGRGWCAHRADRDRDAVAAGLCRPRRSD